MGLFDRYIIKKEIQFRELNLFTQDLFSRCTLSKGVSDLARHHSTETLSRILAVPLDKEKLSANSMSLASPEFFENMAKKLYFMNYLDMRCPRCKLQIRITKMTMGGGVSELTYASPKGGGEQEVPSLDACPSCQGTLLFVSLAKEKNFSIERNPVIKPDVRQNDDRSRVVESLIATLGNSRMYSGEELRARPGIARALGELRDPRAIVPLIQALREYQDFTILRSVEAALCNMGEPAVEPLIKALKDSNVQVRLSAAVVLGKIGDSRAVDPLIKSLKDRDVGVRRNAAQSLGELHDARATESLIRALEEEDFMLRRCAAQALGMIKDPRAVEPLANALKDQDDTVREEAAKALGNIRDTRTVDPLIQALSATGNWRGNWSIPEALGKQGDERAVQPLIENLRKGDTDWVTIDALGKLGDARAVEPLLQVVRDRKHDDPSWTREKVRKALGMMKGPAVDPLIRALNDEDELVRDCAAEALGNIGDRRAIDPLINALKDPDPGVCWSAAYALSKFGRDAIPPLIEALNNPVFLGRKYAATSLGKIGAEVSIEPLIRTLDDADWETRACAAEALGDIGDKRAVEPLTAKLTDDDWHVRKRTVDALGKMGVVEPIKTVLNDENEHVRMAAERALKKGKREVK